MIVLVTVIVVVKEIVQVAHVKTVRAQIATVKLYLNVLIKQDVFSNFKAKDSLFLYL